LGYFQGIEAFDIFVMNNKKRIFKHYKNMKYQEFIDHLLAVYYFNRKANPTFALSPFWIIDMMKKGYGSSDVRDIMNYLDAEGYLSNYNQKSGFVSQLTPRGQMYYEALDEEYQSHIVKFLTQKGILQVVNKLTNPEEFNEEAVNNLIKEIEKDLKELNGIDEDLNEDMQIIKLEYSKRKPDREVLRLEVEHLLEENVLFDKVRDLKYKLSV